jgi:tetratricopeptide (TPR) repeat protein
LGLGPAGAVGKARKLTEAARAEPDSARALNQCDRAIAMLRNVAGLETARRPALGAALLCRGKLLEASAGAAAADAYLEARRLLPALPQPALAFLAAAMANRGGESEEAFAICLEFLRGRAETRQFSGAEAISGYVERQCAVEEQTAAEEAEKRLTRCRRVMEADPAIAWAHYYAGMAHVARRRFADAQPLFARARKLGCQRPDLDFYHALSVGMAHIERRNWKQGLPPLRHACQSQPNRADAWFALGRCLVESLEGGQPAAARAAEIREAVSAMEEAYRQLSRFAEVASYLGRARMLAGDAAGAAGPFQLAVEREPKRVAYLLQLGLCQRALGRNGDARASARAAIALDERCAAAHGLAAEACLAMGEHNPALAEFDAVLRLSPADAAARAGRGAALHALGRYADAIQELASLDPLPGPAARALARSYAYLREFAAAVEVLKAEAAKPEADAWIFFHLALAYGNLGCLPEALANFNQAIRMDNGQPAYFVNRGHAFLKSDRAGDARADYERALAMMPAPDAHLLYCLGVACRTLGDASAAFDHFSKAVGLLPTHGPATLALAALCENRGDLERARELYGKAAGLTHLHLYVQRRFAQRRQAIVCCRLQRFDEAVACWDREEEEAEDIVDNRDSAEILADYDEFLQYRGLADACRSNYAAALNSWEALRKRHPEDQRLGLNVNRLHYLLGKQRFEEGRLADAIAEWTAYLEPRPEDEELQSELRGLRLQLALEQLGRDSGAVSAVREAAALDAANPVFRFHALLCDLLEGRWDDAALGFERLAPELDGKLRALAAYYAGLARLAQNRTGEAASVLNEARNAADRHGLDLDTAFPLAAVHALAGEWAPAAGWLTGVGMETA